MNITGKCHCGAIAYDATVDPAQSGVCHCTDCQVLSGGPFRASVTAKAEDFHIRKGTPKIYIKPSDSGRRRIQGFCGDCGTPIYAANDEPNPAVYNLRLGAVEQRNEITPRRQLWCQSAMPWLKSLESIPEVEKQ